MPDREELKQARSKAFRFLSYRDRSRYEVDTHLTKKGFSKSAIRQTIDALMKLNYINDERFAFSWARSRLETKQFGKNRLRQELSAKGIDPGLTDQTLSKLFSEVDELAVAQTCARKKLSSLKELDADKKRRRLAQFLQRKGFPADTIYKIVETMTPFRDGPEPSS